MSKIISSNETSVVIEIPRFHKVGVFAIECDFSQANADSLAAAFLYKLGGIDDSHAGEKDEAKAEGKARARWEAIVKGTYGSRVSGPRDPVGREILAAFVRVGLDADTEGLKAACLGRDTGKLATFVKAARKKAGKPQGTAEQVAQVVAGIVKKAAEKVAAEAAKLAAQDASILG